MSTRSAEKPTRAADDRLTHSLVLVAGLREHARAQHAPADAQPQAQVLRVRQGLQSTLAASRSPEVAHGGEAVRLRALW